MTEIAFRRGAVPITDRQREAFDAGMMPLEQKEALCRRLLEEFGAGNVRERAKDHELIHGCLVNPERHSRQSSEPTASLNYSKLKYKCLGCGAAGDIVWFIATVRGEGIEDAIRWLRQETGLAGQVLDVHALMDYIEAIYHTKDRPPPMPTYSERMLEPWDAIHPYLTDPKDAYGRGIPEETVKAMRVGYAPDYFIGKRADGSRITSERIVIPLWWKGDLVGWQTRRLDSSDGTAKYLASTGFPKDSTVYNYDPSRPQALMVESAMSVLAHMHTIPEMESTWGWSVTDIQIGLMSKHERVVHWPDPDPAGWDAIEGHTTYWPGSTRVRSHRAGIGEKLSRSTDYWIVDTPWDTDPGDMTTGDVLNHYHHDAVPYSVWTRPTRLYCYRCRNLSHKGSPCQSGRR